ncbi:hypothetical protein ACBP46_00860 [Paenalcaligenes hominis]|jgi:hypothetical protein
MQKSNSAQQAARANNKEKRDAMSYPLCFIKQQKNKAKKMG